MKNQSCDKRGIVKTYFINEQLGLCQESCMPRSNFWIYHQLENRSVKSKTSKTPCLDKGFSEYTETKGSGIPGILSIAIDYYKKPVVAEAEKAAPAAAAPVAEAAPAVKAEEAAGPVPTIAPEPVPAAPATPAAWDIEDKIIEWGK